MAISRDTYLRLLAAVAAATTAVAVDIAAVAKTEDGAHILPRMTITQRATPRAKAASAPAMGEEVRAVLPAAAKASKAALREAAPDKLVQGAVRGLARMPTDLVAGAAALGGKKNVRDKALRASERASRCVRL